MIIRKILSCSIGTCHSHSYGQGKAYRHNLVTSSFDKDVEVITVSPKTVISYMTYKIAIFFLFHIKPYVFKSKKLLEYLISIFKNYYYLIKNKSKKKKTFYFKRKKHTKYKFKRRKIIFGEVSIIRIKKIHICLNRFTKTVSKNIKSKTLVSNSMP